MFKIYNKTNAYVRKIYMFYFKFMSSNKRNFSFMYHNTIPVFLKQITLRYFLNVGVE